ncbi:excalibur calcium-binding domain-containing protein [Micromonospora endophytica]|uniref:excalibur calcium-binding domain-containing protein n=1 Tax=Micromonospora endophytica TaxID=515350 RepID=UPI0015E87A32|nr:excalibur calcium-binding domain-containing protein [Micromonospora endophytica]BCJ58328.1 hypothetical protein Jiend_17500 [Micromonospora endophytica]
MNAVVRTPRRRLLVAAGAVALVILAGFGWSSLSRDGWSAGSPAPTPPGAATASDPAPPTSAGTDGATGSDGPTRSGPTPSAGSTTGRGASTPAPRIHPFANELSGTTRTAAPSPTAPLKVAEGIDGCDHGYGDRNICVPWSLPAGVTDGCAWLRERGYPPLPVQNPRDRHNLDRNGDGIACGPGD